MEGQLAYGSTGGLAAGTRYLNVARDLSRLNSKNEEVTTRDGHVYGYMCEFTLTGGSAVLFTAPNSWKMRNSFRKFDAYRDIMFDNAGVEGEEMGRYGKTIRAYLDRGHAAGVKLVPETETSAGANWLLDGGEWTFTQLATTPIYGAGPRPSLTTESWADAFPLHICEENIPGVPPSDEASGTYDSVGMIHSYNLDRMEVVTPLTADALASPTNPLAALRSTGNQATGEVLDIAIDQEIEEPPYDQDDNGDSIQTIISASVLTTSEFATRTFTAFIPAGVARMKFSAPSALTVRVLGKVLCKDMT
jgi:hypothetical protein